MKFQNIFEVSWLTWSWSCLVKSTPDHVWFFRQHTHTALMVNTATVSVSRTGELLCACCRGTHLNPMLSENVHFMLFLFPEKQSTEKTYKIYIWLTTRMSACALVTSLQLFQWKRPEFIIWNNEHSHNHISKLWRFIWIIPYFLLTEWKIEVDCSHIQPPSEQLQFVVAWTLQGVESVPHGCWPMLTSILPTVVSSWLDVI
jgi:hypothetical protein